MKRSLVTPALLSATIIAACSGGGGGSSGPGNSIDGTINGQPILVKSALLVPSETIGNSTVAKVVLSDKPDICAQAKLGNFTPSSTWFEIELAVATTTGGSYTAANSPGIYHVNAAAGNFALGALYQFNATCQSGPPTLTTAGSANVIAFSSSGTKGTANLTFGSDHVTANFDVESCPELLTISICQ